MEKNAGYLINFAAGPLNGILHLISLIGVGVSYLLLLTGIFFSIVIFTAELIDRMFGDLFRSSDPSGWASMNPILATFACLLGAIWLMWIIIKLLPKQMWLLRLNNLCVMWWTFLFVFVWIILTVKLELAEQNTSGAVTFIIIGVLLTVALRPIFLMITPGTRLMSLILIGFVIGRLSWWKIFQTSNLWIVNSQYSSEKWQILLIVASLMSVFPLNMVKRRFFHYYYRWRLEDAFFHKSEHFFLLDLYLGELTKPQFAEIPKLYTVAIVNG